MAKTVDEEQKTKTKEKTKSGKPDGEPRADAEDSLLVVEPDGSEHIADKAEKERHVHAGKPLTPTTTTHRTPLGRPRTWKPLVAGILIVSGAIVVMFAGTFQIATEGNNPLSLSRNGAVAGYVKDPDGEGIPNAIVSVKGMDQRSDTGDDGRYKFKSVEGGDRVLEVSCYGFRSASVRTFIISGLNEFQVLDLNVTLSRLASVPGTDTTTGIVDVPGKVTDKNTNPVAGAIVSMLNNGSVTTGADGTFMFHGVAPGKALITVEASNHTVTERTFFVQNGTAAGPLTIQLDTAVGVVEEDETDGQVMLSVRLKDTGGNGISGGMVSVMGQYIQTDPTGYAGLQLRANKMNVTGSAYGHGSAYAMSYVPEGDRSVELVLGSEQPENQKGDREDIKGRMTMCSSISTMTALMVAVCGALAAMRRSYWAGVAGALFLTILMYTSFGIGMVVGVMAFILLIFSRREFL